MTKQEFLLLIDEIIEEDPGTLTGSETLSELDGWDSFATLEFMTLADKRFSVTLSGESIANCLTVSDLLDLVEYKFA